MVTYNKFHEDFNELPGCATSTTCRTKPLYKNYCILSVLVAFSIGLSVGIVVPLWYLHTTLSTDHLVNITRHVPATSAIRTVFVNNSFRFRQQPSDSSEGVAGSTTYPTVSFVERKKDNSNHHGEAGLIVKQGIFWGDLVESSLPSGYSTKHYDSWSEYVSKSGVAVKLETGCGRMQNRLVTFKDGRKGCVRYRQNTDQIQGELFSFYLAQILKLPNLAPSTVSVVDPSGRLWGQLGAEIAGAQWYNNRPIVITKFITNLDPSNIPSVFKPVSRHLNRYDVTNITENNAPVSTSTMAKLVELAQWSDLIIFDYLTANLDRIVNNLYNFQWNVNIMDAPAHNLARKTDNDLLVFLDNESGLLHGYRLLKKYEIYHSLLLDNLCMFRSSTVSVIKRLHRDGNIGFLLREMFEKYNGNQVKDVLPTIPDNSVKILNERIDRVYNQIVKCELDFAATLDS